MKLVKILVTTYIRFYNTLFISIIHYELSIMNYLFNTPITPCGVMVSALTLKLLQLLLL
jgi:hypothetical protein